MCHVAMLEFLQQWLKLAPRGVRVEVEVEEKAVWWPSLGPPARRNYHKVLLILLANKSWIFGYYL